MSNNIRIHFILLLLLAGISRLGQAQIQDTLGPSAFSVDSMAVNSAPLPLVGDTIHLLLWVHANVTGPAILHLQFPGNIAPPDQSPGETDRDSVLPALDSGLTYVYSIPLKCFQYGGSLVSFNFHPSTFLPGIDNFAIGHIEVEHSSSSFKVLNLGPAQHDTGTITMDHINNGPATFDLTGTVKYEDNLQVVPGEYGVYGVTVILLFHSKEDPAGATGACQSPLNLHFSHPIDGCISGVHYCKVDANGNFGFHFTANLNYWDDRYYDAELLVTSYNDAAFLGSDPSIPNSGVSTYTIPVPAGCTCTPPAPPLASPIPPPAWTTFRETYALCIPCPHSPIMSPGTIVQIPDLDPTQGGVLRNMEFAQEFDAKPRIGVTMPLITVGIIPAGSIGNSYFKYSPLIDIAEGYGGLWPSGHEYGHYLNFQIHNGEIDSWYTESFAEFHQFALRNYVSPTYGDEYYDWAWDNQEEGPFRSHPRYGQSGHPDNPEAGFACFLWNVYDAYSDPGFKASRYDNSGGSPANNDDVGEPSLIFKTMASEPFTPPFGPTVSDFKDLLLAAVSPGWPAYSEEAHSIDTIYTWMMDNNDPPTASPMRPAQVTNLGLADKGSFIAEFSWSYQNYASGSYQNLPTGVHIYQIDPGAPSGWDLLGTANYPATSVDLGYEEHNDWVFKVSSFNSSLDSYNPPIATASWKRSTGQSSTVNAYDLDMTVHPNPAMNLTRICVPDLPAGVPATVIVVNSSGDIVSTLYDATPDAELGLCLTLDCSKLANGTYFARLWNDILGKSVKISVEH